MNNPKVEVDIADILNKLDLKIDKLSDEMKAEISDLKKDTSEIKTDIAVIKNNQENFKQQFSDIQRTQKNQIWSLITILTGTLISITVAYFKAK